MNSSLSRILPQHPVPMGKRFLRTVLLATLWTVCASPCAQAFQFSDAINLGAGELTAFGGSPSSLGLLLETNTLSLAPTARLDLRDNALLVRQTPFATVYGYVLSGYNGGAWDGFGVSSRTAATDSNGLTGLGIIDNSDAHFASFEGRSTLAGAETFVKYTLYGDANLDGLVDGADLALMSGGGGWYHGDFNYSGMVDAEDVQLFEIGRASQIGNAPEPGTSLLLGAGVLGLFGRRRSEWRRLARGREAR